MTHEHSSTLADIQTFYDARVERQLRDFIDGNARVERAWSTVESFAPQAPRRILEIGCGIGTISWRMTRRWPLAEVLALDVSPESLRAGERLFGSPRLRFVEGPLATDAISGTFDLVVLVDVYEHIALEDRPSLHAALSELIGNGTRIVIASPTPRHLSWLRRNHPEEIQPIDEDITIEVVLSLASDTGTELSFYEEVGVWHQGDYLHAVLERQTDWLPVVKDTATGPNARRMSWLQRVRPRASINPSRTERAALVKERLGNRYAD